MKTLQEFQSYFERELHPKLVTFQAERDATRPRFLRVWPWWLLTAFVLAFLLDKFLPHKWWVTAPMMLMWIATIIVVPVYFFIRHGNWAMKYGDQEKKLGLEPAIRFLAPEFDYQPSRHVAEERVRKSRIFALNGDITEMGGDDRFSGRIGATAVEFSEVWVGTTAEFEPVDKDARLPTYNGLFMVADFNKPFEHATLIVPDLNQRRVQEEFARARGGLKNAPNVASTPESDMKEVRLESLEFGRLFEVRASDRVEAYYILTPDIMERLIAFRERTHYGLMLSFVDTTMCAFIHCGPLFEEKLDADVTQFAAYQPYYEQLHLVFDLVEAMNLNTRLWGKA